MTLSKLLTGIKDSTLKPLIGNMEAGAIGTVSSILRFTGKSIKHLIFDRDNLKGSLKQDTIDFLSDTKSTVLNTVDLVKVGVNEILDSFQLPDISDEIDEEPLTEATTQTEPNTEAANNNTESEEEAENTDEQTSTETAEEVNPENNEEEASEEETPESEAA